MITEAFPDFDARLLVINLRRIMARQTLTYEDVCQATGLDERTVRAIARAQNTPHARTISKLAAGLGVAVDELFQAPINPQRAFDRATNPIVDETIAKHKELFHSWREEDVDELHSRFGVGGQLTEDGVLEAARAMNDKRELRHLADIVYESSEAWILAEFVRMLHRRVTLRPALSQMS